MWVGYGGIVPFVVNSYSSENEVLYHLHVCHTIFGKKCSKISLCMCSQHENTLRLTENTCYSSFSFTLLKKRRIAINPKISYFPEKFGKIDTKKKDNFTLIHPFSGFYFVVELQCSSIQFLKNREGSFHETRFDSLILLNNCDKLNFILRTLKRSLARLKCSYYVNSVRSNTLFAIFR